jgi:hypothetical protein
MGIKHAGLNVRVSFLNGVCVLQISVLAKRSEDLLIQSGKQMKSDVCGLGRTITYSEGAKIKSWRVLVTETKTV